MGVILVVGRAARADGLQCYAAAPAQRRDAAKRPSGRFG